MLLLLVLVAAGVGAYYLRAARDSEAEARRGAEEEVLRAAGQVVVGVGWDVASGWTWRDWIGRLAVAGILGLGGMVTAGERNARPEVQP